jgi:thiol-disulfide isomerase/thioredoxin
MKLAAILIYATLLLYANTTFSHDKEDPLILKEYFTGSLKNIVIHKIPKPITELNLFKNNNTQEIVRLKQNHVTIINFWATWCAPCREEMPSLNALIESIGKENFSVIVVAAGRNSDKSINAFFNKHKLSNLLTYKDPLGKVSSKLSILGLPTTLIVDQHSNEIARLTGEADWNSESAIKLINHILALHN